MSYHGAQENSYPCVCLRCSRIMFQFMSNQEVCLTALFPTSLSVTSANVDYYPNGMKEADEKNTVEHIEIHGPFEESQFTVKVKGTAVPMSPQPFALVISGPLGRTDDVKVVYHPHGPDGHGQCGSGQVGAAVTPG